MVGDSNIYATQTRHRAKQSFGLPPRPTEGWAQQRPRLDGEVRVMRGPAPPAGKGRMPRRDRFGRDPQSQAATILPGLVLLAPVLHSVSCLGKLVAACFIDLVGHRLLGGACSSLF
jgi:hypothetical protein